MIRQKFEGGELRVEALQNSSAGHSLCYIDQSIVNRLLLSTGSIVEIKGQKRTAGIVMPSIVDKGKNVIRLDELQRLNAGVKIGDIVSIRKRAVFIAEEIEFTPILAYLDLTNYSNALKVKLIGKPLVNGDLIDILGDNYQKNDQVSRIMKLFKEPFGSRTELMRLVVERTIPSNEIVRVTKDTKFKINNAKLSEDRKILSELFSYISTLEERFHNIDIEKKLIHLERQRLDYGKRILDNAIKRINKIIDKLMEILLLPPNRSETVGMADLITKFKILEEHLTKLENSFSKKPKEEIEQNLKYCAYCGEELKDNPIFCPHCGAQIK